MHKLHISWGGERLEEEQWSVVQGVCATPGAEGVLVYGVQVRCRDGSTWCWPDVDVERAVVDRLARRLQAAQPERCHYEELVLDFIQEVAGAAL